MPDSLRVFLGAPLLAIMVACGGRVRIEQSSTTSGQGGAESLGGAIGSAGLGGVVTISSAGAAGDGALVAGSGGLPQAGFAGMGGVSGISAGGASGAENLAGSAGALNCGVTANGAPCGMNEVCFNGACAPCIGAMACSPSGDPCQVGMTACGTGQLTCLASGNAADGTACAAGMCCGGACSSCSTSSNATNTCSGTTCELNCNAGFSLCGGLCVDTTSDDNACGSSCLVCPMGGECVGSHCLAQFSTAVLGASCSDSAGDIVNEVNYWETGLLGGQPISISSAVTVTALGVVAPPIEWSGVQWILALYSSVGAAPSLLLAQTASTTIVPGKNEIPVLSPMKVPAGSYWIMAEVNASALACPDGASNIVSAYAFVPYGTVPSSFGPAQTSNTSAGIDYLVIGVQ